MKDKLDRFLQQSGYFPAVSSLPEFLVYFLPCSGNAEVIVTVDYQKEIYLTKEIYEGIKEKFIHSFKEGGFTNVHILTLVLHKESERIEAVFGEDHFAWYLDTDKDALFIPQNHAEDFYGLKAKVEQFLTEKELYEEDESTESACIKKEKQKRKSIKELPYINGIIILINMIVFLLYAFNPEVLYNGGAFSIFLIRKTNEYYRFLTSVFIHADLNHLLSNMLVLFFLGNCLESKVGHLKYAVLYLISALGGNLLSAIYEDYFRNMLATVGASGAIFGVIAAVFILVIVKGGRWENITLSRMLLMIAYSLYSGFISENVNNAAHIGGFVAGMILMIIYCVFSSLQKKKEVSHEN